jgi:ribonuclease P protein component
LEVNRFGILVSTKISKKAVVRNRIKRKIRGALKSLESKLENGYDFVILTLPPIIDADFFIICQDLDNTFKKLKING